MKKYFVVTGLMFCMAISPKFFIAQENNRVGGKEDVKHSSESGFSSGQRNNKIYDKNILIDGVELDKRVAKYYTDEDMKELTAKKVKQLNYMYLRSFNIVDKSLLSADCLKFIDEKFDTGAYEKFRKQEGVVVIEVKSEGFSFKIELLSRDEMMKKRDAL